jgi:surface polysaccharide O-acyltransferase-like enzyme
VLVQQLALFSVPVFLFISGFFVAYASRSHVQDLSWKVVQTRMLNLLWPYLIWSIVVFAGKGLQGEVFTPTQYIRLLLTGGVTEGYYFVPLLCQLYLLSPIISRLGKNRPILLLAIAAAIQLLASSLFYLQLGRVQVPGTVLESGWLFIWQVFYFALGVVAGFRSELILGLITRFRWVLIAMTVALAIGSVLEAEWLYAKASSLSDVNGFNPAAFEWTHSYVKISSSLYAVVFILTLLSLNVPRGQFVRAVNWIGTRSYGIYLLHPELLRLMARIIYRIAPWLLAQQLLLMAVLVVASIGIALVMMGGTARSPMRSVYRYLYG